MINKLLFYDTIIYCDKQYCTVFMIYSYEYIFKFI